MSDLLTRLLVLLLSVNCLISCGFVDLRQIGFSVEPDKPDYVLSDSLSPVIIRFDTEMEKTDVGRILQISSYMGVKRGDYTWKGNDLYFVPVPEWTAGIRYTVSLTGTMRSVDGRELRLHHFTSFYAVNNNEPPLLEKHYPFDGSSVGTNDMVLEFHFSRSMDRQTTESALTIEGTGNKTYEWSDDEKILKVILDKALSPWTSYKWNLRDSARSADGVPLPKTYSGWFITNKDLVLPHVTRVFPVLYSNGSWYPARFRYGSRSGFRSGNRSGVQQSYGRKCSSSASF
jgi:hypothetical protein